MANQEDVVLTSAGRGNYCCCCIKKTSQRTSIVLGASVWDVQYKFYSSRVRLIRQKFAFDFGAPFI